LVAFVAAATGSEHGKKVCGWFSLGLRRSQVFRFSVFRGFFATAATKTGIPVVTRRTGIPAAFENVLPSSLFGSYVDFTVIFFTCDERHCVKIS
jgi:hypothetical protein